MEKNIKYILIGLILLLFTWGIGTTARINEYRGLCNQYREQLSTAEALNRDITDRLGRVAEITGRINETANSNVADARGIIETVEKLRTEIQELEDCCGGFNQCGYYQYWDDYFDIE